eukprot:m51a1_g8492 hypothetical protein (194) ;mRNA; r:372-17233
MNLRGEVFLVHAWPPINETANIRIPGYPEAIAYPQDEQAALEKQQMYVNHCLKIAQAFYNYIKKGLHYSNWAEFKTCIKEICKQSHSKKITSKQYKNTAGNVEKQFNSKKMNLQTFQESIKLRENLHKWLQENGMTKRLRADKDSDLDSPKEAEDEAWNPKVLSDEEKKRPHKKHQGESKTQISAGKTPIPWA